MTLEQSGDRELCSMPRSKSDGGDMSSKLVHSGTEALVQKAGPGTRVPKHKKKRTFSVGSLKLPNFRMYVELLAS